MWAGDFAVEWPGDVDGVAALVAAVGKSDDGDFGHWFCFEVCRVLIDGFGVVRSSRHLRGCSLEISSIAHLFHLSDVLLVILS